MKKKYFVITGLVVLFTIFIFQKPYNKIGDESKQCKTLIFQKQCFGKNVSTPTSNPCATSAVCYGWLTQ